MNLARTMRQSGFHWDPTGMGQARWTHFVLGITCLRQPFMSEDQWETEQKRCAELADKTRNTPPQPAESSK